MTGTDYENSTEKIRQCKGVGVETLLYDNGPKEEPFN